MPGILPMKVIKIGSSAQPRIAQACDRCRSKKIRCDGIRPSCTQCLNVGFECKTSDKLSRRAFPRGYTESLEERVRTLEQEVRELKDLLDEKDEKIDMLSRIRSGSSHTLPSPKQSMEKPLTPSSMADSASRSSMDESEDVLKITQSAALVNDELPSAYFMGTSSPRSLICALKRRIQEQGKDSSHIQVNAFFPPKKSNSIHNDSSYICNPPAVMLSDRLVQVFFQEFAPLFPILHRPTFLKLYNEFLASLDIVRDTKALAQLYLVFAISGLSNLSGALKHEVEACESQFKAALSAFQTEDSLVTVQCLTLATLYFMMKGDYASMLKYKGHAVSLSQRLGLQHEQKNFTFDALTLETRKRVFWSLFTLDSFSAAHLGLPTLLTHTEVYCETPVDADDEYVSEKGFLHAVPGESTKLSSALALFRLSMILSKILQELYPSATSYELSFRKIAALQDELDKWSLELAPHLRLHFEKDKPSTRIVSDRSPIISLAYQYTHTLISRPAVLAAASTTARSTSSILSLALASKRIVQIVDLLQERNMVFAFCLNEQEVLQQAAFGLLFETLELCPDSAVHKDTSKIVRSVVERMDMDRAAGVVELRKFLSLLFKDKSLRLRRNSDKSDSDKSQKSKSKRGIKAFASKLTSFADKSFDQPRRGTYPYQMSPPQLPHSTSDLMHTPLFARSEPALSPPEAYLKKKHTKRSMLHSSIGGNVYSLGAPHIPLALANNEDASSPADWERLLSNLDNGQGTIYDGIYGGPGVSQRQHNPPSLGDYSSQASSSPKGVTNSSVAKMTGAENIGGGGGRSSWSPLDSWSLMPDVPQSVMSFASDETPNLDDFADLTGFPSNTTDSSFGKAIVIPGVCSPSVMVASNDVDLFAGLDLNFGN